MDLIDLVTAPCRTFDAVLALNAAHAAQTSPLDDAQLRRMVGRARLALARPDGLAFVLGFAEGADYDSPNYRWFCGRYDSFVYVDRIVVSAALRGRGVGRALYGAVVAEAGRAPVVCEVNVEPPNPVSDAFHAALGFVEVGQARLLPDKAVRYMLRAPG